MKTLLLVLLIVGVAVDSYAFSGILSGIVGNKSSMVPIIAMAPSTHDYGSINTGSTGTPQTFTVSNTGLASGSLGTFALSGTNSSEFTLASNTCTGTLGAGANCTMAVNFAPTSSGAKSAIVGDGTYTASLSGTGAVNCTSGTYTGGVDWLTTTTTGSGTNPTTVNTKGQSFKATSTNGVYSVKVYITNGVPNGLVCRLASTSDLSSYLATTNSVSTNVLGIIELPFTTHPVLTNGTTYYFGCLTDTDSPAVYLATNNSPTENYPDGSFHSKTGGGWGNMTINTAQDLRFGVTVCQ
jgi:hypothetical protein